MTDSRSSTAAVCSNVRPGNSPDAHPADVESVVEGRGVVVSGTEEISADPAQVTGSGVGGEVGAAVEDPFAVFHEAPSKCEALAGLRCQWAVRVRMKR